MLTIEYLHLVNINLWDISKVKNVKEVRDSIRSNFNWRITDGGMVK